MRFSALLIVLFATIITNSCKKAFVEVKQAQKLETHTSNRLNKIKFINQDTGYIVGGSRFEEANILLTFDGGNTWSKNMYPEAGKGMYGIDIANTGRIFTVGFDGKLLYSDDNGINWQFVQLKYWYPYKDIAFQPDNSAIIIGGSSFNSGTIIHVSKDGETLSRDSMKIELNEIELFSDDQGYISCYGAILKTTDGGTNWGYLDIKNDNFSSIYGISSQNLWTCGYAGSIYRTTDGGKNWEKQRNGNKIGQKKWSLLDIHFKDTQTGWACGEKGLLVGTIDGGNTWSEYEHFTDEALRNIQLSPNNELFVVGDNGTLFKLTID